MSNSGHIHIIEEKYIELMNREVDGLTSGKEKAELKRYLRKNPEAERYYRELQFVAGVLNRVPEVEPPAELKASILRSIFGEEAGASAAAREAGAAAGAEPGVRVGAGAVRARRPLSILDVFRVKWEPRLAYVLAACVAVAFFLFVLFWRVVPGGAPRDLEALYGSIVSKPEAGQLLVVQPIEFTSPGVDGEVHVRYEATRILVALDLRSDSRIQAVFGYSGEVSLKSITALNGCEYSAKAGDGGFELTHDGDCRYVIVLDDRSGSHSPVGLRVVRGGTLLLEETAAPSGD